MKKKRKLYGLGYKFPKKIIKQQKEMKNISK
jgi:hypothetical protein